MLFFEKCRSGLLRVGSVPGVICGALFTLLPACAPIQTVAAGVGLLVLSPFIITAGLAQGLAFIPHAMATNVDQLNEGLQNANATSLNTAYFSLYGVDLADRRVNRTTGDIQGVGRPYRDMLDATSALQEMLIEKGMPPAEASHYLLCSIDNYTQSRGHILLSVVRRKTGMAPITVVHKHDRRRKTLRSSDPSWREPYRLSADGAEIDEVVDWIGTENKNASSHKFVALMMVSAIQSIEAGRRSPDYWQVERRWIAGETEEIIAESMLRGRVE